MLVSPDNLFNYHDSSIGYFYLTAYVKSLKFRKENKRLAQQVFFLFVWDLSHKNPSISQASIFMEFYCFFFLCLEGSNWAGYMQAQLPWVRTLGFLGFWIQELSSYLSTKEVDLFLWHTCVCVCTLICFSHISPIFATPWIMVPPGSSTHGIFWQEYCSVGGHVLSSRRSSPMDRKWVS